MTPEEITRGLIARSITQQDIAIRAGVGVLNRPMVSACIHRVARSSRVEAEVAAALGLPIGEVFPEWYTSSGERIRATTRRYFEPAAPIRHETTAVPATSSADALAVLQAHVAEYEFDGEIAQAVATVADVFAERDALRAAAAELIACAPKHMCPRNAREREAYKAFRAILAQPAEGGAA